VEQLGHAIFALADMTAAGVSPSLALISGRLSQLVGAGYCRPMITGKASTGGLYALKI